MSDEVTPTQQIKKSLKNIVITGLIFCFALIFIIAASLTETSWGEVYTGSLIAARKNNVNIVNTENPKNVSYKCIRMLKGQEYIICMYNPTIDIGISKNLNNYGSWELDNLRTLQRFLELDPTMGFIDVGANLGVYTLYAAAMERHVVAVEALLLHAQMLSQSIDLNKFHNRITLVNNALSNVYTSVCMKIPWFNPGGTKIEKNGTIKCPPNETATTIFIDDLLPFMPFSRAVMKIDIEGHELLAFKKAKRFFRKIFIPYIFMEWVFEILRLQNEVGKDMAKSELMDQMLMFGYLPYTPYGVALNVTLCKFWPIDILWIHKLAKF